MVPAGFRRQRWSIVAALLALPVALAATFTAGELSGPEAALQRIADDAALAGVTALAASAGQPDPARIYAAVAASKAAALEAGRVVRDVTASPQQMTASVTLLDPGRRSDVNATARYIPPSAGASPQTSAGLDAESARPRVRM